MFYRKPYRQRPLECVRDVSRLEERVLPWGTVSHKLKGLTTHGFGTAPLSISGSTDRAPPLFSGN